MRVQILPGTGEKIFRVSAGVRWLSLLATGLLGLMSIAFAVLTALMWREGLALVIEFALITAVIGGLAGYVGRDLDGKWRLRFVFGPEAVTADLPKGRSAIHRPPRQHLVIPYREIAAIETRLEAYRSFGMAMMQKPYVLRWRSGATTFLFEQRALGSGLASSEFANVAAELQARSAAPLSDLGMVEGRAGILGVWGARPADWSAPSLTAAQQARLWKRVVLTGLLASGLVAVVMLVRFLAAAVEGR